MIVEVIAVGTELLLGQIVNSNASFIGAALAEKGLDAHFQQVVGDNLGRVAQSIRTAMDRSDAVIITGGIGPTQDDLTREAVCQATGLEMEYSDEYAQHLREWWSQRGRDMPESNLRQAQHPAGANLLDNPRGTAPGLSLDHDGTLIFCVPGVPEEMQYLIKTEVVPALTSREGSENVLVSRLLRTWGRSESDIAEVLDDLYQGSTNPSVAFLASAGEIKIRLSAKGHSSEDAGQLIAPLEVKVRERLGSSIFGVDDETIEVVLFRLLEDRNWRIGTAESMTGGMVAAKLTDLAGSSRYFAGGVVAYESQLKQSLLGVEDVREVVNEQTALAMAEGARKLLGVEVGVSVTGSAGPEPMEKPAGTIVVGVATPENSMARELRMVGDRERIRTYATTTALHLVRLGVSGDWWGN
ncbi:MAG TPA: competence/damage-inducible protein A [Acidimicrobiia bacterium]